MIDKTFLILGGGGMVGFQVARRICKHLDPETVIIASLYQQEVREAMAALTKEYPEVNLQGFWGDLFVRSEFNADDRQQRATRAHLLQDEERRTDLYEDLFGDVDAAYQRSQLAQIILRYRPDVIVDGINTATAISYQDIYTASQVTRRDLDHFLAQEPAGREDAQERMVAAIETLLISQYIPQLIRHVILINRAMREAGTRLYLKVGTTGTGGMGLNIPYTHGEDKPSAKLISKTAVAFAHTGLLFLMARTVGGPIVKEVKPAALIGWVDTNFRAIRRVGKPAYRFGSQADRLVENGTLQLRRQEEDFERLDKLRLVVADTGENGVFAKGEFETITTLRQMELITPEEIARAVELEIKGINTGTDLIPAIDGALMGPTYRGGYLRRQVIDDLNRLEEETEIPSVALGELGPPEISKLLWEAFLLKQVYGKLANVLEKEAKERKTHGNSRIQRTPEEISTDLYAYLNGNSMVADLITSTGGGVLLPDGATLLRGPFLRIPEVAAREVVHIQPGDIDRWANKGWVDLRPVNMKCWLQRFDQMRRVRQGLRGKGSAAVDKGAYLFNKIFIGEVVGWVFNNEMGGYRIK